MSERLKSCKKPVEKQTRLGKNTHSISTSFHACCSNLQECIHTCIYPTAYLEIGQIGNSDPFMVQICKAVTRKDVFVTGFGLETVCFTYNSKCHTMNRLGISAFVTISQHSLQYLGALLRVLRDQRALTQE